MSESRQTADGDKSQGAGIRLQTVCEGLNETDQLAGALARASCPGLTIGLVGNLGTGKTRFTQGFCVALGISAEEVTSPTFVLIQEYEGKLPVFHLDTYRLKDADEFDALGIYEMFESDGVCLVEWANRFPSSMPHDALWINIKAVGDNARQFTVHATGPVSRKVLRCWKSEFTSLSDSDSPTMK